MQSSSVLFGLRESVGRYTASGDQISFAFEPWGEATGTVRGDSLTVAYDLDLYIDGFQDGVYVRRR